MNTRTGSRLYLPCLLGVDEEHDIALRRIDIGILEQKHLVYTILLENGELDEKPDWTSQILAYDKILFTSNLHDRSARKSHGRCVAAGLQPYSRLRGESAGPSALCP